MLFNWLRESVKRAVIEGVNSAVAELAGATGKAAPEVSAVTLLLPYGEPEQEEPAKGRKTKAS